MTPASAARNPQAAVRGDQVQAHVDARQAHGLLVDAHRIDGAARRRVVQVIPDDRQDHGEDQGRHRQRTDKSTAEQRAEQRIDRVLRCLRVHVEEPAQAPHCRERHDERLQLEARDDDAVEDADREPHGQRHDDRDRERHLLLQAGRQQPGKRHHRADREVDAAGQDDQEHAEAEQPVGNDLPGNADDVALGQERIGRDAREYDERDDRPCEGKIGRCQSRELASPDGCRVRLGDHHR